MLCTEHLIGFSDDFNLLHDAADDYQGFQPTFETDITDFMFIGGSRFKMGEFNFDVSTTYGINSVDYRVENSLNPDLGALSPTEFEVGGYRFSNTIGNLDISRSFDMVSLIFGAELKMENFRSLPGDPASYFGSGVQSFPGLQPGNRVDADRTSIGAYLNTDFDITEDFLISGAVRYENYDDFGGNFSYKVSSRYKIGKKGAVRASYSTGFRAPSFTSKFI